MSDSGIFKAAVKLPPDRRAAYLDQAAAAPTRNCAHFEIESLLRAHDATGGFLEHVPAGPNPTGGYQPPGEQPGNRVGPYKLLQQIGEGGMGVVYMAEQTDPVRRRVALKIIKPGMDSQQVIARFEAERQALAMMDHQNIAKVLDAGTTESGRPFFVMELVHGVPITQFCDDKHLTLANVWPLFVPVCCRPPRHPARAPEGDHPPRRQAVERPGDAVRRQAGAQGDRLRRGQGDRAAAHRADDVHAVQAPRNVRGLHEP